MIWTFEKGQLVQVRENERTKTKKAKKAEPSNTWTTEPDHLFADGSIDGITEENPKD